MPQMAPLNWLSLYVSIIIVFMMFNSLNYFCFLYTPKSLKSNIKNINLFWKW